MHLCFLCLFVATHRCRQTALRFSMKALTPSFASSVFIVRADTCSPARSTRLQSIFDDQDLWLVSQSQAMSRKALATLLTPRAVSFPDERRALRGCINR